MAGENAGAGHRPVVAYTDNRAAGGLPILVENMAARGGFQQQADLRERPIVGDGWMPPDDALVALGVMLFRAPVVGDAAGARAAARALLDAGADGIKVFPVQTLRTIRRADR